MHEYVKQTINCKAHTITELTCEIQVTGYLQK